LVVTWIIAMHTDVTDDDPRCPVAAPRITSSRPNATDIRYFKLGAGAVC